MLDQRAHTTMGQHWYMLAYCWANMMALRRANILALRKADEQNYVGPTPFYFVGPMCTYYHEPTLVHVGLLLGQHYVEPTCWPYVGPISKITLGQRLFDCWANVHVIPWTYIATCWPFVRPTRWPWGLWLSGRALASGAVGPEFEPPPGHGWCGR